MAYLWRAFKVRIQHMKCASYRDTCSLCESWKLAKRKAAIGCPDDCPVCTPAPRTSEHPMRR